MQFDENLYSLNIFLYFAVKLNGGRHVIGVLRGFDPFMNLVLDEAVEKQKNGEENSIGIIVWLISLIYNFVEVLQCQNIENNHFNITPQK